eukprot:TRINITY_DN2035_c0_g1_i1.p1 TRINITY_DN2035_c0_g1~~TRINITY_DN2035_c0_g1_i1.p1  ORF type:complete len:492 (+),score=58.65 TRINITY_DN2035_c0_g1_i1:37-1476(+)
MSENLEFALLPQIQLPVDVLSLILTNVPIMDIYGRAQLVCRSWKDIVCDGYFCRQLSRRYWREIVSFPNFSAWNSYFKEKVVLTSALDLLYGRKETSQDWHAGLKKLDSLVKIRNQYALGLCAAIVFDGIGVNCDENAGLALASASSHPIARVLCALAAQDQMAALRIIRSECDLKDPHVHYLFGRASALRSSLPKAARCFTEASTHCGAMAQLVELYYDGIRTERLPGPYIKQLALAGIPAYMKQLGNCHLHGLFGVERNDLLGYQWFARAEEQQRRYDGCQLFTDYNTVPTVGVQQLPTEMLSTIFSFLSVPDLLHRVCLVCHSWNAVVKDDSLWAMRCAMNKNSTACVLPAQFSSWREYSCVQHRRQHAVDLCYGSHGVTRDQQAAMRIFAELSSVDDYSLAMYGYGLSWAVGRAMNGDEGMKLMAQSKHPIGRAMCALWGMEREANAGEALRLLQEECNAADPHVRYLLYVYFGV